MLKTLFLTVNAVAFGFAMVLLTESRVQEAMTALLISGIMALLAIVVLLEEIRDVMKE